MELRHLALESCFIHPPTVFKGFDCLTVLELNHVESSDEFFRNLISNCQLLEPLALEQPYCLNLVEIESPTLRSFVYAGLVHEVHLKKVPLLAKVSVTFSCSPTGVHALAKFFESIPALEHFRWCIEVPRRLSFALNCLKHLHINLVYLDELPELQGAVCFIRSSPYSQDIEIQVYQRFQPDEYLKLLDPVTRDYVDEIPASFSDVTLNHLKAVKLEGIAGTRPEMQLIQLLLAKSPALARMKIDPYYGLEDKKSLKVVAEITNFQRASSKAEVVYNVD
ncbi:uncharacterized protein LOC132639682 [Lycium barbarum]|uniref:uncharacterized protein LOC132639682 n=1 Tax=Lycium barbarum TaxID=112863 RepID=UPI00293EEDBD|nr:uncharacterized protein LOC132639682 [Lycium barbarum]